MTLSNLDVFDTLANIIPGVYFLLIVSLLPPVQLVISNTSGEILTESVFIVLFTVIAYIIGYSIQSIASLIEDREHDFERILIENFHRGDSLEYRFIKGCEQRYGLSLTVGEGFEESLRESKLSELYWIVREHLLTNQKTLAERWLVLSQFSRGILVTSILGFPIIVGYQMLSTTALIDAIPIDRYLYLIVLTFMSTTCLVSYIRSKKYEFNFAKSLVSSSYSTVLTEHSNSTIKQRNTELQLPQDTPTTKSANNQLMGVRFWPILLLRRLRISITQRVITPLKNGNQPKRTDSLFTFFLISSNIIEQNLNEIITNILMCAGERLRLPKSRVPKSRDPKHKHEIVVDTFWSSLGIPKMEDPTREQICQEVRKIGPRDKIEALVDANVFSVGEKGQMFDILATSRQHSLEEESEYREWMRKYTGNKKYELPLAERPYLLPVGNVRALETKVGNAMTAVQITGKRLKHFERQAAEHD